MHVRYKIFAGFSASVESRSSIKKKKLFVDSGCIDASSCKNADAVVDDVSRSVGGEAR